MVRYAATNRLQSHLPQFSLAVDHCWYSQCKDMLTGRGTASYTAYTLWRHNAGTKCLCVISGPFRRNLVTWRGTYPGPRQAVPVPRAVAKFPHKPPLLHSAIPYYARNGPPSPGRGLPSGSPCLACVWGASNQV